jgi:acyl carrier protein
LADIVGGDVASLPPSSSLRNDLLLDSLDFVELVERVESVFNVELNAGDPMSGFTLETLGELRARVEMLVGQREIAGLE